MNRLSPRISAPKRYAPSLQRTLVLAALSLCSVFGATSAFAESIGANAVRDCRNVVQDGQKNAEHFRRRPFSVLTNSTFVATSIITSCGTAASSVGTGISSSTTERERDRALTFIDIQREALWQDMAGGQGERLVVLATLMGCTGASRETFQTRVQAAFGQVISTSDVTPVQVWEGVHRVISEDRFLSRACSAATVL